MKSIVVAATGIAVACVALSGCRPVSLGANYGESYEAGIRSQISHPERVDNVDRGDPLDGMAAEYAVQTYRKTFEPKSAGAAVTAPSMVKTQ